jgi:hypothetical protein
VLDFSEGEVIMLDLNDETRWILGRPNFSCIGFANRLRQLGHEIENKAEDEQAAVIHWMLIRTGKDGFHQCAAGDDAAVRRIRCPCRIIKKPVISDRVRPRNFVNRVSVRYG